MMIGEDQSLCAVSMTLAASIMLTCLSMSFSVVDWHGMAVDESEFTILLVNAVGTPFDFIKVVRTHLLVAMQHSEYPFAILVVFDVLKANLIAPFSLEAQLLWADRQ